MRARPLLAPLLLALVLVGAPACSTDPATASAAAKTPPPPTVIVQTAARHPVSTSTETVAVLDGYVNAEIRARVRGYLKSQLFKDGGQVKTGQLLFTIDPSEYSAVVAQAEGALGRADALAENSELQLTRANTLIQTNTITQRAVEDANAAAADAKGQRTTAKATLERARLDLSYTQIRSPIDGTAGLTLVRVGNLVGADGPTLLTTISQVDPIRVRFPISEIEYLRRSSSFKELSSRDLKWARKQFTSLHDHGTTETGESGLELILADGSTYAERGVIVATDRSVNGSTGTILLEALFPNPDQTLRPGQYGRVRMQAHDSGQDSLVVPERALMQTQGMYSLAVVSKENKVELRPVQVGVSTGQERVIVAGLTAGERIVVDGLQKVSDGAQVVPQEAQTAAAPTTSNGATAQGSKN
ncbi:MAG: efflux RND transporter periplasmic adaptor subunit [Myxococcales bacterium]